MQNYQNKNENICNNHSLYDSNKQQIINIYIYLYIWDI